MLYYANLSFNDEGCVPEGYALRVAAPIQDSALPQVSQTEIALLENHETKQSLKFPGFTFSIYPNPNNGAVNISTYSRSQSMQCSVCDVMGRVVYFEKLQLMSGRPVKLQLDLKAGIYYLNLIDEKNTRYVKKIVVN